MKINEIALNENVWTDAAKLAGKALPRIERLPGETMIDAIKRTTSALGGVKSADNLASPSGPAVWRRPGDPKFDTTLSTASVPSTSGTIPKPIVPAPKTRANTSAYDREVLSRHDLNPGMPNKGKPSSEAEKYLELKQAQAARTAAEKQAAADDWTRQVSPADDLSKEIKPSADAVGGRREPSINTPADDLAKQIKPGADAPKTTGGRQEPGMGSPTAASDTVTMPKDVMDRILKLAERDPVAAKSAAEEAGIPWGKVLGYGTLGTAAIASPAIYNAYKPDYLPAAPAWSDVTNAVKITPAGDDTSPSAAPVYTPPAAEWPAAPAAAQPVSAAPTDDPTEAELQQAREADPEWQRLNKELKDRGLNESTKQLNRIVFLSRP